MTRPRINVMLRGEQTAGEVSLMDNGSTAGAAGPPLHHHDFDELFYVVAGELVFQLGDELMSRRAGEVAFAPRGVAHTYANQSGADARFVLVCTPAGFERYFAKLAAEIAGVEPPPEVALGWPEVTKVGPQIGDRRPDDAAAGGPTELPPPGPIRSRRACWCAARSPAGSSRSSRTRSRRSGRARRCTTTPSTRPSTCSTAS